MDARIIKDIVVDEINRKIEILKKRGIIVVDYKDLLSRLQNLGYTEAEVQDAIRILVRDKQIKAGKYADGKGWLRDYREIDKDDDLRPK